MKRYIAQFSHSPNHYVVVDTQEGCILGEPKQYHEANDEAGQRNDGTFGKPTDQQAVAAFQGWYAILPGTPP